MKNFKAFLNENGPTDLTRLTRLTERELVELVKLAQRELSGRVERELRDKRDSRNEPDTKNDKWSETMVSRKTSQFIGKLIKSGKLKIEN